MGTCVPMPRATRGFPEEITAVELHWLAGLLEGEGSFHKGPPSNARHPVLALQMTDEDVVARVAAMWGRKLGSWQAPDPRWRRTYMTRIVGAKAVAWMTALRPLMGSRRQTQIDLAVASYDPRPLAVLDDRTAREALGMLLNGDGVRTVAERFGASIWCMYDLRLGRT